MTERIRIVIWAVLAVIVAVAMLFVCSTPAMAENTAAGVTQTGSSDANGNAAGAGNSASGKSGDIGSSSGASSNGSDSTSDSNSDASGNGDGDASGESTGSDSDTAQSDDAADKGVSDNAQSDGAKAAADDAATQFVADLKDPCDTGQTARTITVTTDITLTTTGIHPQCDITIVSDGNPHTITWGGSGSVLWIDPNRSFTIGSSTDSKANNLTFTNNGNAKDNPSNAENPLFHNYGTVTINGGTFKDSVAARGSIVLNNETLNINGGMFVNNKATGVGGGVVYQDVDGEHKTPVTTITGGTFSENAQEYAVCTRAADGDANTICRDGEKDDRGNIIKRYTNAGGGAIHTDSGKLSIQGDVKFERNHANAAAFMTGGGAIYANGELWILNSDDDSTKKPLFDGNWTAVGVGEENTQYLNNDTEKKVLPTGGAGGAIFLQKGGSTGSRGYFMGGKYTHNTSGYLGGAIYTEEGTTSYVGKAVATANVAGHFGGGLWLCPSGSAQASEGGNIALFGNSVDYNIDSNTDNHGDQYMAGDDFAMMNPKGKDLIGTTFRLMNTWFMDRAQAAVTMYWDGTPRTNVNGFSDKYQAPGWNIGAGAVQRYGDNESGYALRYQSNAEEGTAHKKPIVSSYPANLQVVNPLRAKEADPPEATNRNLDDQTQTWAEDTSTLRLYTGVALTAELTAYGSANKQTVQDNAALIITDNAARLSGGAFGSNGVVSFSSPYSASWDKVDATDNKHPLLSGSVWTLKTAASGDNAGGAMNPNMRPSDCRVLTGGGPSCWHTDDSGEWLTVDIADQGARDTNPNPGQIGVDNLKPGVYYLTEKTAPDNYQKTENEYVFTVAPDPKTGLQKVEPTISLSKKSDGTDQKNDDLGPIINGANNAIGNTPRTGGVSWSKTNTAIANNTALEYLSGSEWEIFKYTDEDPVKHVDSSSKMTITDYEGAADRKCDASSTEAICDTNAAAGRFTVDGLAPGTYKLVESTAPEGYVKPADGTFYTFTIESDKTATLTKWENDQKTTTTGTEIANTPTEVDWSKIDANVSDLVIGGAQWTLTTWNKDSGSAVNPKDTRAIVDCADNACASASNTAGAYVDKNPASGHFTIRGLKVGSSYKLVETTAPKGYQLPDATTTYAIITISATGTSQMDLYGEWNKSAQNDSSSCVAQNGSGNGKATRAAGECQLTNKVISISALPFTGGFDARDWLLFGGIAAVTAAITLALINEYRKRKGLA